MTRFPRFQNPSAKPVRLGHACLIAPPLCRSYYWPPVFIQHDAPPKRLISPETLASMRASRDAMSEMLHITISPLAAVPHLQLVAARDAEACALCPLHFSILGPLVGRVRRTCDVPSGEMITGSDIAQLIGAIHGDTINLQGHKRH
jgi:hypothetical protein